MFGIQNSDVSTEKSLTVIILVLLRTRETLCNSILEAGLNTIVIHLLDVIQKVITNHETFPRFPALYFKNDLLASRL